MFLLLPYRMAEVGDITPTGEAPFAAQSPWIEDKYRVVFVSDGVFMD
ncbi:MAG: hypothetical protein IIW15_08195 [Firmicutes bacterium]|nr:hypothetical protein [Bacillota bacterium]